MKRTFFYLLVILFIAGCTPSPGVELTSAYYVKEIDINGNVMKFEDGAILKVDLDFQFDDNFMADSDLDVKSDSYRKELFSRLAKGAHVEYGAREIDFVTGYWPQEVGNNFAKEMTLFFVVPRDLSIKPRFIYDGKVLGDDVIGISKVIHLKYPEIFDE